MEPSEEGSSTAGDRDRDQNEQELATRILNIQAKRFYVDVKENQRGRFIKLAEVAAGRRKNRIIFPMSTTAEFRDRLTEFQQASDQIGPTAPTPLPEDGKLRSAVIVKDFRRYYLDLKENERGRFVRVSLISRGARSQIGIPAQGISRLRDAFTELIAEFGSHEEHEEERVPFHGEMPKSRSIRVENKTFYFDVDQNTRGMFMKISEVKPNFRSSITIPERSWGRMRDIISEYMLDVRHEPGTPSAGSREPSQHPQQPPPPPSLPSLETLAISPSSGSRAPIGPVGSGGGSGAFSAAPGPSGGFAGGFAGRGGAHAQHHTSSHHQPHHQHPHHHHQQQQHPQRSQQPHHHAGASNLGL